MISLARLTRRYRDRTAETDLCHTSLPDRVTGFLGLPGAERSSTLRMTVGLAAPMSRHPQTDATVPTSARRPLCALGASLTAHSGHPSRSVRRHLMGRARSNGVTVRRVDEVLETVGLAAQATHRVGTLSSDQRQRLCIAGALLGDPLTLLFDEPVEGHDPDRLRWARALVRTLADGACTVLLESRAPHESRDHPDELTTLGRVPLSAQAGRGQTVASDALNAVRVRTPQPDVLRQELADAGMSVRTGTDGALLVMGGTLEEVGVLAFRFRVPIHELSYRQLTWEQARRELASDHLRHDR